MPDGLPKALRGWRKIFLYGPIGFLFVLDGTAYFWFPLPGSGVTAKAKDRQAHNRKEQQWKRLYNNKDAAKSKAPVHSRATAPCAVWTRGLRLMHKFRRRRSASNVCGQVFWAHSAVSFQVMVTITVLLEVNVLTSGILGTSGLRFIWCVVAEMTRTKLESTRDTVTPKKKQRNWNSLF